MSNFTSKEEYISKKEQVLNKFHKEFIDKNLHKDPTFRTVYEMLMRDTDPYQMIEWLIEYLQAMKELNTQMLQVGTFPPGWSPKVNNTSNNG